MAQAGPLCVRDDVCSTWVSKLKYSTQTAAWTQARARSMRVQILPIPLVLTMFIFPPGA